MKEMTMRNEYSLRAFLPRVKIFCGACGVAATILIAAMAVTVSPHQAQALPAYAAQTGFACGRCHVNPAGGGPNTAFGKAFAANDHKVPAKTK